MVWAYAHDMSYGEGHMKLLTSRLIQAKELLLEKGIWHGTTDDPKYAAGGTMAVCSWLAVDKSDLGYTAVEDILIMAVKATTGEDIGGLEDLYAWNDRSSDATILTMYDKAIELSKTGVDDVIQFAHGAEPASDYVGGSWPEDH
jgi:hypothetical protein